MKRSTLDAVRRARGAKDSFALVTDLESGAQSLVRDGVAEGDLAVGPDLLAAVARRLRDDRGGVEQTPEGRRFVQIHNPPLRMFVIGAVHIAQTLAPMARLAGYDVTLIDPRGAFATTTRFPGLTLNQDWPDDALKALRPDARSAIVLLSHDPKLDDPALRVALRSPAFYIGALGSTKTHAARLERLRGDGFGEAELARIRGPVGLDICAKSPPEIAISILAQATQTLRAHPGPRRAAA